MSQRGRQHGLYFSPGNVRHHHRARLGNIMPGGGELRRIGGNDRAALVVHAGTALTADVLSRDGEFLGGVIVPGHDLMRRALAAHTAGLRRQPGAFHHFPRTTGDAIASGTINALCGTIERIARFMEQGGEKEPLIVIGGGDADRVAEQLGAAVQRVDNLVLEGLVVIAREHMNT
jgi:type III pantothenate kinase